MCADWTDPRNVGSAFRLAEAAGLERIVLTGITPRPPNPRIAKTARSTVREVPYTYRDDAAEYLKEARGRGAFILALEITDRSESLFSYRLPHDREIVLLPGAERSGVTAELLALCDTSVHLPMHGRNTSMNVAVALGAATYLLLMQLQ